MRLAQLSRALAAASALTALATCSGAREDRESWLVDTLVRDNYALLRREPARVAEKFAKMGADPYDFARGALALYLRDVAEAPRLTAFASAESSRVLALLDPHPENLGSFRAPDGRMTLDFADFDAARYAPFHLDVWRLALGLGLFAERASPARFDALTAAAAEAYARAILEPDAARPPPGRIVDDLLFRAARDGDADVLLRAATSSAGGARALRRGELEPRVLPAVPVRVFEDVEPRLEAALRAQVPAYLGSRLTAPARFAVVDAVRVLGSGVASLPSLRCLVLVDEDGTLRLLEWKEAREPPSLLAAGSPEWELPLRLFATHGQRQVEAARALWTSPALDVRLGWTPDFRVREASGYQKGLSIDRVTEKVMEGSWGDDDLEDLARTAGDTLARTHARARTASGGDARAAIAAVLGGRVAAFRDEVVARAREDAATSAADFARLQAALATEGPLLGFRP
jgi:uncharacterized protein (DUF2252 family)